MGGGTQNVVVGGEAEITELDNVIVAVSVSLMLVNSVTVTVTAAGAPVTVEVSMIVELAHEKPELRLVRRVALTAVAMVAVVAGAKTVTVVVLTKPEVVTLEFVVKDKVAVLVTVIVLPTPFEAGIEPLVAAVTVEVAYGIEVSVVGVTATEGSGDTKTVDTSVTVESVPYALEA